MPYTPPAFNAIEVDLRPVGKPAYIPPQFNAIEVDLAYDDTSEGGEAANSADGRYRNFAILLAI